MVHYTIDDINSIKKNGFSYILPDETQNLIIDLSKLVGSPDYIKTPVFHKNIRNKEPDWELLKNFKPTQKTELNQDEKIIQSIKGSLNKLTDKNYDTMSKNIFEDLSKLESSDKFNYVNTIIFNIASSNRFYSVIYANLFNNLIKKYDLFKNYINDAMSSYLERFNNILDVNPNEDYDLFCEENKKNEEQKALTEFIVNLNKQGVIEIDRLVVLFEEMFDLVLKYKVEAKYKSRIIELSENIFILLNSGFEGFKNINAWTNILSNIETITVMKVKDYPGLSNKSIFKFMDIMDIKG